jgi:hypothetical protein
VPPTRHRLVALLIASAVAVTACGDDAPGSPTATEASVLSTIEQEQLTAAEFLDEAGTGDDEVAAAAPPTTATPVDIDEEQVLDDPMVPPVATVPLDERPALPASVAVVGDSIARSATDLITSSISLHGIEILAYDALESRRMAEWGGADLPSGVSAIDDIVTVGAEPELWIVALGTNDVGAGTSQEAIQDDIDEVLAEIPDDAAVFWVDTWVRDLDDRANMFNLLVRATLADRPNSWVLDWHALAEIDGLISDDGVHLTARGQLEYARMIGRALRDTFTRSQA